MTRTRRQKRLAQLRQAQKARMPSTTVCPTPGKRKYPTEEDAERGLGATWRRPGRRQRPVRAYLCPCGAWHLTKRPG